MTEQIDHRIKHESRLVKIESMLDALIESTTANNENMGLLIEHMHKAEERHDNDRRWKDFIQSEANEQRNEFKEFKKNEFEPVRQKAERNAAYLFMSGSIVALLAGALATKLIGG